MLFLVLLACSFYFSWGGISGMVGYGGGTGECSDSSISSTWDRLFVTDSTNIITFRDSDSNCSEYISYKLEVLSDGVDVYFIHASFRNAPVGKKNVWILRGFSGKYRATLREDLTLNYFSVSQEVVDQINSLSSFSESKSFFLSRVKGQGEGYTPWDIFDEEIARFKFESIFGVIGETLFETKEDYYGFESLDVNNDFLNKTVNVTYLEGYVLKNRTSVGMRNVRGDYSKIYEVYFIKNISDFEFERNSTKNFAFDFKNHIVNPNEVGEFGILFRDLNNSNGEWVNYEIDGSEVTFSPKRGFIGSRKFMAYVSDKGGSKKYSNQFKVNIVKNINDAPVVINEIKQIEVPLGGLKNVNLRLYFEDPDEDNLSYRLFGAEKVSVSFIKDIATFRLLPEFSGAEKVKIYGNDGKLETGTDWFFVFLDNKKTPEQNTPLQNNRNANTPGFNNLPKNSSQLGSNDANIVNKSSKSKMNFTRGLFWGGILFGVFVVLGGFVILIRWYLKREKKVIEPSKDINQSSQNKVNDYLAQIRNQDAPGY